MFIREAPKQKKLSMNKRVCVCVFAISCYCTKRVLCNKKNPQTLNLLSCTSANIHIHYANSSQLKKIPVFLFLEM